MNTTISRLEKVYEKTNGAIKSKAKFRLVDKKMNVGILTMTNQFVPFVEPVPDVGEFELEKIENVDDYGIEKVIGDNLVNKNQDTERIKTVRNIELEQNFYQSFRNNIRLIINNVTHRKDKQELLSTINDISLP